MEVKSDLQKKLEGEGWAFLENVAIADKDISMGFSGIAGLGNYNIVKPTKCQLLEKFKKENGKALVEQAYDTQGNPLNHLEYAAVYVIN